MCQPFGFTYEDGYGLKEPCHEDNFFLPKERLNVNDIDISVTVHITKRYASDVEGYLDKIAVQDGGCVAVTGVGCSVPTGTESHLSST